jgi:hypothetical protein
VYRICLQCTVWPLKTETFDNADTFLRAAYGTRRKRGKAARPDLPRAPQSPRTGLSTFLLAGWSLSFVVGVGYKLRHYDGRDTGWHIDEKTCCDKAREL